MTVLPCQRAGIRPKHVGDSAHEHLSAPRFGRLPATEKPIPETSLLAALRSSLQVNGSEGKENFDAKCEDLHAGICKHMQTIRVQQAAATMILRRRESTKQLAVRVRPEIRFI